MAIFEEEAPGKKLAHAIGEELSVLSIEELEERIVVLRAEIGRIEAAIGVKRASADVAKSFFRR